ncbi:MAG: class III extradiol ring-cleavage dioxygenase [Burkholderiaceae bacterium]
MSKVLFIPHGGGPLPLLNDPGYAGLSAALRSMAPAIADSKAIVLVTAHWETETPSLTSSPNPGMIYDYFGFPPQAYQIVYSAPGAPELAQAVSAALTRDGFKPVQESDRGYDHGVYVPMILMRPEADIPILQMSVLSSLDPTEHIFLGQSLASVLDDDITVIGSGFSFHNLGALTGRAAIDLPLAQAQAKQFHDWLDEVTCGTGLNDEERKAALVAWADAPGARFCQPREEHLMPLHVCFGAANARGMKATQIFGEPVKGFQASGYLWQDEG